MWKEHGTAEGLIDPLGAEDVKLTGGENVAGAKLPQPDPPLTRTLVSGV